MESIEAYLEIVFKPELNPVVLEDVGDNVFFILNDFYGEVDVGVVVHHLHF